MNDNKRPFFMRWSGLVTAVRTLSILPMPGRDAEDFGDALPWFPLVGCALGAVVTAGAWALSGWPAGAAALALGLGIILTRALHLDGLADCADGFGGGRDREKVLAIMKDSHVGAFGVVALVVVLLFKWVALARLVELHRFLDILTVFALSRTMQVELAVTNPYARETGTAAAFVRGARASHRWIALGIGLLFALAFSGCRGWLAIAVALAATHLFGAYCRKRVGGITGDLIGASSEITELLLLFAAALG